MRQETIDAERRAIAAFFHTHGEQGMAVLNAVNRVDPFSCVCYSGLQDEYITYVSSIAKMLSQNNVSVEEAVGSVFDAVNDPDGILFRGQRSKKYKILQREIEAELSKLS